MQPYLRKKLIEEWRGLPQPDKEIDRTVSIRTVLNELANHARAHAGPISASDFSGWMNQIKEAAGVDGNELFHPIRIALTGTHSGPEFEKLIPLIEQGVELNLGIPSVRDRLDAFVGV